MQVWLIPIADKRVGVQVKLRNPLRTRAIPERFCGGDSLRRGAISSVMHLYLYRCQGITQFYLHTLRFIRERNEPYLLLPSQPQLVLTYRPRGRVDLGAK